MGGPWLVISGNVAFIAVIVAIVGLWLWRKATKAKKSVEDSFVAYYAESLESISKAIASQEQAVERLRLNARELGMEKDHSLQDTILQVQNAVTMTRGEHAAVAHSGRSAQFDLEMFRRVKAECDSNWTRLVQVFLDMFARPIQLLRELSQMDQQRQMKISSATQQIAELERQVDEVSRVGSGETRSQAANEAIQGMETTWHRMLADYQRQDEKHQKVVKGLANDLDHLEGINKRLSAVMTKLRERQRILAERLKELQGLAEMTPRLREELARMTEENALLQNEIREMEESRATLEQKINFLRATIEELKSQPSRTPLAEAQAAQDRQVMQLLREQNQRLVLELEEAHELNDQLQMQMRENTSDAGKKLVAKLRQLEDENKQLADECEHLQIAMKEKEKDNRKLATQLAGQ